MEMAEIVYSDYDKISDLCMYLSSEYVLKFYVELYKKSNKRGRIHFHNEVGYDNGDGLRVNVSREFNYYLSIESISRNNNGIKSQTRIYINDIYFLKAKLHKVFSWFNGNKSIFAKKDNNIFIPSIPESIIVHLTFDNYLEFEPGVININQEQLIGVKIYLGNDVSGFFMDVNTLFTFMNFIDNFNMFQSAQLMLSYIGAPSPGTNYYAINNTNNKNKRSFIEITGSQERKEIQ